MLVPEVEEPAEGAELAEGELRAVVGQLVAEPELRRWRALESAGDWVLVPSVWLGQWVEESVADWVLTLFGEWVFGEWWRWRTGRSHLRPGTGPYLQVRR